MTRSLTVILFVALLAGCGSPSEDAEIPETLVPAGNQTPSFDCAAADGDVETLICGDAGLAALDRQLAEIWEKALANVPEDEVSIQRALQRGWIGGRNECWKETEVRACVESSYQTRLAEIQIQSGLVMAATAIEWTCTGGEMPGLNTAFYSDIEPRAVVLTVGGDQVIAIAAEAASGARYVAPNVEFWEHQGEATLEWFGTTLTCTRMAAR